MKPLSLLAACCAAAALFAIASCGQPQKPKCGPTNCQGCCTSNNLCVSGQTTGTCGKGGEACAVCAAGLACQSNACVLPAAGGGSAGLGGGVGGAGGGVAGGTGGGAGGGTDACITVTRIGGTGPDVGVFTSDTTSAFDEADAYVNGADAGELLWVSEYYMNGAIPSPPRTVQLASTTWQTCSDCVVYSIGCVQNGCLEDYLAQSGTLQIDQLTQSPDAGVFSGSVMNVHLVQWDGINNTNPDGPVAGGKCLDITLGTFNGTWP